MQKETKEERFQRIAERRVQRVVDSIRSLAQTSNRRMYSWNDGQMKKIWNAIEDELRTCKISFEKAKKTEFKL
jgi:DNA repair photolyase